MVKGNSYTFKLESIEEPGEFMWLEKHLKAIPKAKVNENGQEVIEIEAYNKGILEELKKAHIYIAQLNEKLKGQDEEIKKLKEMIQKLNSVINK